MNLVHPTNTFAWFESVSNCLAIAVMLQTLLSAEVRDHFLQLCFPHMKTSERATWHGVLDRSERRALRKAGARLTAERTKTRPAIAFAKFAKNELRKLLASTYHRLAG